MLTRTLRNALAITAGMLTTLSVAYADNFTLRIGSGHPSGPTVYVTEMEKFFVPEVTKRVKARTSHTVNFVEAWGGTVAKVNETLSAVESGLLDIGGYCVCFEQSKLPMHNFPYWVPFGPTSSVAALNATRKVYAQFPQLTETLERRHQQRLLAVTGFDNYHLGTTFPWEKLTDLKGRKIGAVGVNMPWLQGSGAVGVMSGLPDMYNSMKSGVFEGVIMFPSSYLGFKFFEPAPHLKLTNFGAVMVVTVTMNNRSFNRLPPEVRNIIVEVAREYEDRVAAALDAGNKNALDRLASAGTKITSITDQARREWAEGIKDWPNRMAKDVDKQNLPASELMRAYLRHLRADGWTPPAEYVIQ